MLPVVTPILEDLTDVYIRLGDAAEIVRAFEARARQNGHTGDGSVFDPAARIEPIEERLRGHLQSLDSLGVVLKDIEIGLIDFPAKRDGRDVYLCWHLGEDRVAFWHDVDEGYRSRQPL
jgi:hypothetical protein